MVVAGSDPLEYYVWCEDHDWSSPRTTSDSAEADRWMDEHQAEPLAS
jgi:hypothetical protein